MLRFIFIYRKNERHLTQSGLKKQDYYAIYKEEMESRVGALPPVSRGKFTDIWRARFPNIKLPRYTAVQTKCLTCSLLDVYYEEHCHTKEQRAELKELRKYHASMYRKQRLWYHQAREKAMKEPDQYMSCIGDGMAQIHNSLPSYSKSGTQTAPMTFDTHFQGMITHGKRFTIFRSFGNVGKGTNVAVYSWLRHLEIEYRRIGYLPDTLFFQIDGGSENANEILVGIAELLIHWGLTKRIFLTRLPVGHTHEDIDGKFGTIWQHTKMFNILTPQRQSELTVGAFKEQISRGFEVNVEDVVAVPDYRAYIKPYAWLTRAFKSTYEKPYTQLQFIVEKVDVSDEFPLGARTMYRAYPTDSAVEIISKETVPFIVPPLTTIGLMALRIDSLSRPTSEDNNGGPAGARVMNCVPEKPLQVSPFKEIKVKESNGKTTSQSCKVYLQRMVYAMETSIGTNSNAAKLWREFAADFPQTDTAEEYVKIPGNRYHVPFAEFFDRTTTETAVLSASSTNQPARKFGDEHLLHVTATAIAKWGPGGKGFPEHGMKSIDQPRVFPDFEKQGLSGAHLIPPKKKHLSTTSTAPKPKTYNSWNKTELKLELEKRSYLNQNGTNREMKERLRDDDQKIQGEVNNGGTGIFKCIYSIFGKFVHVFIVTATFSITGAGSSSSSSSSGMPDRGAGSSSSSSGMPDRGDGSSSSLNGMTGRGVGGSRGRGRGRNAKDNISRKTADIAINNSSSSSSLFADKEVLNDNNIQSSDRSDSDNDSESSLCPTIDRDNDNGSSCLGSDSNTSDTSDDDSDSETSITKNGTG
jgi:hypothetical protein